MTNSLEITQSDLDLLFTVLMKFEDLESELKELVCDVFQELTQLTLEKSSLLDELSNSEKKTIKILHFLLACLTQKVISGESASSTTSSKPIKATKSTLKSSSKKSSKTEEFSRGEWTSRLLSLLSQTLSLISHDPSKLWKMGYIHENYLSAHWEGALLLLQSKDKTLSSTKPLAITVLSHCLALFGSPSSSGSYSVFCAALLESLSRDDQLTPSILSLLSYIPPSSSSSANNNSSSSSSLSASRHLLNELLTDISKLNFSSMSIDGVKNIGSLVEGLAKNKPSLLLPKLPLLLPLLDSPAHALRSSLVSTLAFLLTYINQSLSSTPSPSFSSESKKKQNKTIKNNKNQIQKKKLTNNNKSETAEEEETEEDENVLFQEVDFENLNITSEVNERKNEKQKKDQFIRSAMKKKREKGRRMSVMMMMSNQKEDENDDEEEEENEKRNKKEGDDDDNNDENDKEVEEEIEDDEEEEEDDDDHQKPLHTRDLTELRDSLFDILIERAHDTSYYTRSALFKAWIGVIENQITPTSSSTGGQVGGVEGGVGVGGVGGGGVPYKRMTSLLEMCVDRLQDRTAIVRKNAMGLMISLMDNNPFSGNLEEKIFLKNEKLIKEKLMKRMNDLRKEAERIVIIRENIEKQQQIQLQQIQGGESMIEMKTTEGDNSSSSTSYSSSDSSSSFLLSSITSDEQNEIDLEIHQTAIETQLSLFLSEDTLIQSLSSQLEMILSSLSFVSLLTHSASQRVSELLQSKNTTDVIESIRFFSRAVNFGVSGSAKYLTKTFSLIWHNDTEVQSEVLRSFRSVYLSDGSHSDPPQPLPSLEIASNLCSLLQRCEEKEKASFERIIGVLFNGGGGGDGKRKEEWKNGKKIGGGGGSGGGKKSKGKEDIDEDRDEQDREGEGGEGILGEEVVDCFWRTIKTYHSLLHAPDVSQQQTTTNMTSSSSSSSSSSSIGGGGMGIGGNGNGRKGRRSSLSLALNHSPKVKALKSSSELGLSLQILSMISRCRPSLLTQHRLKLVIETAFHESVFLARDFHTLKGVCLLLQMVPSFLSSLSSTTATSFASASSSSSSKKSSSSQPSSTCPPPLLSSELLNKVIHGIAEILLGEMCGDNEDETRVWFSVCEEATLTLFHLSPLADHILAQILPQMFVSTCGIGGVGGVGGGGVQNQSAYMCSVPRFSRFLFLIGQSAVSSLLFVENLFKASKAHTLLNPKKNSIQLSNSSPETINEEEKADTSSTITSKGSKSKSKTIKASSTTTTSASSATPSVDSLEEEMGLQAALDAEADKFYSHLIDHSLVSDPSSSLLSQFIPLIAYVFSTFIQEKQNNNNNHSSFSHPLIKETASLALVRCMSVSPLVCEKYLPLLFTALSLEPQLPPPTPSPTTPSSSSDLLENQTPFSSSPSSSSSPSPSSSSCSLDLISDLSIHSTLIVSLGDLVLRFPNLLEPWTNHIYAKLSSPHFHIKYNALLTLSHLILNDMVKVKGQIVHLVCCLSDSDPRISSLASLFFHKLSERSTNPLLNLLSDIIGTLSSSSSSSLSSSSSSSVSSSASNVVVVNEKNEKTNGDGKEEKQVGEEEEEEKMMEIDGDEENEEEKDDDDNFQSSISSSPSLSLSSSSSLSSSLSFNSTPPRSLTFRQYKETLSFLLSFIKQEKQAENLLDRLILRLASAKNKRERERIAVCIGELTVSEKGVRKIIEAFKSIQEALYTPSVLDGVRSILSKARKNKSGGTGGGGDGGEGVKGEGGAAGGEGTAKKAGGGGGIGGGGKEGKAVFDELDGLLKEVERGMKGERKRDENNREEEEGEVDEEEKFEGEDDGGWGMKKKTEKYEKLEGKNKKKIPSSKVKPEAKKGKNNGVKKTIQPKRKGKMRSESEDEEESERSSSDEEEENEAKPIKGKGSSNRSGGGGNKKTAAAPTTTSFSQVKSEKKVQTKNGNQKGRTIKGKGKGKSKDSEEEEEEEEEEDVLGMSEED